MTKYLNIVLLLSVIGMTTAGLIQAGEIYSAGMAKTLGLIGPAHDPID